MTDKRTQNATRIATYETIQGKTSYWRCGVNVFRLSEYEPVQFDIYGLPCGARWECTFEHWQRFRGDKDSQKTY